MALPFPSRLLFLSAALLFFSVSELACAPDNFDLTDASRQASSSTSRHFWRSVSSNEGLRYQHRSILDLPRLQPAYRLTDVSVEDRALQSRISEPETRPMSDAKVLVGEENTREQVEEEGVTAHSKLVHKRVLQRLRQKPTGLNSLERSEGFNTSRARTDTTESLHSDSAGEAQGNEKGTREKEDTQNVVPVGKGQQGPLIGDSTHFTHGQAPEPPLHLAPNTPANTPDPVAKKDDIKNSQKGAKNISDSDIPKDDIEKQAKGSENAGSKQDSDAKHKNECGESRCEDSDKVLSACLRTSGEENHMLFLSVTNGGSDNVTAKVLIPEFLRADPPELLVKKGTTEMVQIFMDSKTETRFLNLEEGKSIQIGIKSGHGECQIEVPIQYLRSSTQQEQLPHSSLLIPIAGIYAIFFLVLITAGVWVYCKYQGRKRPSDGVKYQELEMNVSGVGTPKEMVTKSGAESTDGWDQVWDDDWEDTEALRSSLRLSQSLSSRGLAARRGNKDGWDNSWED